MSAGRDLARAEHRARAARLARKPIHARPLSHDETPSGVTAGDRVEIAGSQDGMTLLEHYAGLAMAAMQPAAWENKAELARHARACAEALIEELAS